MILEGLCTWHVRTYARIPLLTGGNLLTVGLYVRTKFERDRPNRCRVAAGSEIVLLSMHVARAHVWILTLLIDAKHSAVGPLGTYQFWARLAQSLPSYSKWTIFDTTSIYMCHVL